MFLHRQKTYSQQPLGQSGLELLALGRLELKPGCYTPCSHVPHWFPLQSAVTSIYKAVQGPSAIEDMPVC